MRKRRYFIRHVRTIVTFECDRQIASDLCYSDNRRCYWSPGVLQIHTMRVFYALKVWHNTRTISHINISDVIMSAMASQITGVSMVCSNACSSADQRKYQSSSSLAFLGEFANDRWILLTKGQQHGKCFHSMTSSWLLLLLVGAFFS